jgi:hypothetical protein
MAAPSGPSDQHRQNHGPHLVALVRAGVVFHKGKFLERPIDITPETLNAEPQNAGSEAPEITDPQILTI